MKCLQCHSEEIVKDVHLIDRGNGDANHDIRLVTYNDPNAWVLKGAQEGKLTANVCVKCGFVMLSTSISEAISLQENQTNKA